MSETALNALECIISLNISTSLWVYCSLYFINGEAEAQRTEMLLITRTMLSSRPGPGTELSVLPTVPLSCHENLCFLFFSEAWFPISVLLK